MRSTSGMSRPSSPMEVATRVLNAYARNSSSTRFCSACFMPLLPPAVPLWPTNFLHACVRACVRACMRAPSPLVLPMRPLRPPSDPTVHCD